MRYALTALLLLGSSVASSAAEPKRATTIAIAGDKFLINGQPTYRGRTWQGHSIEGLLFNSRMVQATFDDRTPETAGRWSYPDTQKWDPDRNTNEFVAQMPIWRQHGLLALTLNLQGGSPQGYSREQPWHNSALNADGTLDPAYLGRLTRVLDRADELGMVIILGIFYFGQDERLKDEAAVMAGVDATVDWLIGKNYRNVLLEINNECNVRYDHAILKPDRVHELIVRARERASRKNFPLLAGTSYGGGTIPRPNVVRTSDFLLLHGNGVNNLARIGEMVRQTRKVEGYRPMPILFNEDDHFDFDKPMNNFSAAISEFASWGYFDYRMKGEGFDEGYQSVPVNWKTSSARKKGFFKLLSEITGEKPSIDGSYFPPPESKGGWRTLDRPDDVRRLAGMDPVRLAELAKWLRDSDKRDFAAVVIRNGYLVLEVERGNSARTDARRVASVSKAVCATVLAIAAERSQRGQTPRRMSIDDPAFDFIPWAHPLSDPRKAKVTVRQLLNHTSGICPEATGAKNDGTWEYILGHTSDPNTARLAFDPGTACGYSTHAFHHAALVCETVTGKPYDAFAVEALFQPIGCEHWWFQQFEGSPKYGKHPSHGLGMPARDLARIAYCLLRGGRWEDRQVVPQWFLEETATATHTVKGQEMRFKKNAQTFSHGWELPAIGASGSGIPADARHKPGSGGQYIAFVPSLDLVITRQTGGSGSWEYEEYLRRACAAVLPTR